MCQCFPPCWRWKEDKSDRESAQRCCALAPCLCCWMLSLRIIANTCIERTIFSKMANSDWLCFHGLCFVPKLNACLALCCPLKPGLHTGFVPSLHTANWPMWHSLCSLGRSMHESSVTLIWQHCSGIQGWRWAVFAMRSLRNALQQEQALGRGVSRCFGWNWRSCARMPAPEHTLSWTTKWLARHNTGFLRSWTQALIPVP